MRRPVKIIIPGQVEPREQIDLLSTPAQVLPPAERSAFWSPSIPRPVQLYTPPGSRGNVQGIRRIASTCVISKPGASDPYAELMATVPDLLPPHEGPDAMEMAGAPEGMVHENWRPTSRYYNGVTDNSARGRLEESGYSGYRTTDGMQITSTSRR